MLRDMLRKCVSFMAPYAQAAVYVVAVDVVFCVEEILGLCDSKIELQNVAVRAEPDFVLVDTSIVREPRVHSIERLFGWSESILDLRRRPVLAVVGGSWVGNVHENSLEFVQV
jgi:hypothetical protein